MEIENVFHGWHIDKSIGEGAYGKVYRIVREDFGHQYEAALKVIEIPQNREEIESIRNEGMTEEGVTLYFQSMVQDIVEEFALMSRLKGNSNIVSYEDHAVIEKEEEMGWYIYIRMELLPTLYEHIKKNTLTVRDVIRLGIDICHALEICQKYNIIHRDIKPENIYVSDVGTFKLGDFGTARQLEKTSSGLSQKGTLMYMAPEICHGKEYNSTVDIYSLGIVLYRFLNNNRFPFMPDASQPVKYSDRMKAYELRYSGEPLPKPCNAEGRLAEIVLKACAYNPKERYESAYEMRKALQSVMYTDEECKYIYPDGDMLRNESLRYLSDSGENLRSEHGYIAVDKMQKKEVEKELRIEPVESEGDSTVCISAENILGVAAVKKRDSVNRELRNALEVEEPKKKEEKETVAVVDDSVIEPIVVKKSKMGAVLGGIGIGTIAVVILFVILWLPSKGEMPDFQGLTVTAAEELARKSDLKLKMKEEFSDSVEAGSIISQSISVGEKVKKGEEVSIVVSKGKENVDEIVKADTKIELPAVVELTQEEAVKKLEKKGFVVKIEKVFSNKVKSGIVTKQKPEAGSKVDSKSYVTLTISKGEEKVDVPDLSNLSLSKAKSLIKKASLKLKITYQYSDSVKKGHVIRQSIGAGKKVTKNAKVLATVSKGKKVVVVVTPAPTAPPKTVTKPSTEKKTTTKKKSKTNDNYEDWNLVN